MKSLRDNLLVIFFCTLFWVSCSPSDNQSISLAETPDNDSSVSDGGTYNPSESGSTNTCDVDDEGDCVDEAIFSGTVTISVDQIDFGMNEMSAVECESITIPAGFTYAAEIDTGNTSSVEGVADDGSALYQFALQDSNGDVSQERVEGSGEVTICYLRSAEGTHTGQIKLVLNADETSTSAYAYVIKTQGQTLETFFTIASPIEGQIFDAREGHNAGIDTAEGDYLMDVSGSVNLDLVSILASGMTTDIIVDASGYKTKLSFDDDGNFSNASPTVVNIGVPKTPGIYAITFSAETTKDDPIEKIVNVVVADDPEFEIEVRDASGVDVATAAPTDTPDLIVGLKVSNLDVSGSNASGEEISESSQTALPVTLSDITLTEPNGNVVSLSDDQIIWYDDERSWCYATDDDGEPSDFSGFDVNTTYCIKLAGITELKKGLNRIDAKATNDLGEKTAYFDLIVDNDKPIITISSPQENELLEPGLTQITLVGTVQNFEPFTDTSQIPAARDGDTGSYCQPDSATSEICPESSLQLWFNRSKVDADTYYPITIYPQLSDSYTTSTVSAVNDGIYEATPEQCRDETETETVFDGDATNTTQGSDGSVTTTVTADDGTVTTYTTAADGTVTISSSDGSEPTTVEVANDDDTTDTMTTVSTDSDSGAITQTTTQRICNATTGTFSITLDLPSDGHHAKLNLYSNVLHFEAASVAGHRSIKVVSFQTGHTEEKQKRVSSSGSKQSLSGTLTAGTLGNIIANCDVDLEACVERAPLMLNLSEGIFNRDTSEGKKVVIVLENFLNENVHFTDVANGWPLPENDDGETDMFANFRSQYKEEFGSEEDFEWFTDLDDEHQQKFIQQGLHTASMAQKNLSLINYKIYKTLKGDCDINKVDTTCFFERYGDPQEEYNVAADMCGESITTAFVPLRDLKYINEAASGVTNTIPFEGEWPLIAGTDINFNDFMEGKWHVDSINIKDEGYIDLDICLIPSDIEVEKCSDDVSDANTPAFWGSFTSYNLVKGGLLGNDGLDDDTFPLLWSIGKIHLRLENVLAIRKKEFDGSWTNYIDLIDENIINENLDVTDLESNAEINTISIEPFEHCDDYYEDSYNSYRDKYLEEGVEIPEYNRDTHLPFGCFPASEGGKLANYPFILDRTSTQGDTIYRNPLVDNGNNTLILSTIWQGVVYTFKKLTQCTDTEMVNPLINEEAFPYPVWVSEQDKINTSFEWEDINIELFIDQSDLEVTNGGITARLPLSVGVDGVSRMNLRNFSNLFMTNGLSGSDSGTASDGDTEYANISGHLVRSEEQENLGEYPLQAPIADRDEMPFLGVSINVEELANAATYLMYKKGPLSLLETFGVEDVEVNNNWSIGVDKVILSEFDICSFAGALSSDFPPGLLFTSIQSQFDSPFLHLDVELDKNYPLTVALSPIEDEMGDDVTGTTQSQAAELQLGINNLQIVVKELLTNDDTADTNDYKIADEEKLRVRMDGVISLKVVYYPAERRFNIFLEGLDKQNIHLSVPEGHGGPNYDDVNVVSDLMGLVGTVFANLQKDFTWASDGQATMTVVLDGDDSGAISLTSLQNATLTMAEGAAGVGSCDGKVYTYSSEATSGKFGSISITPATDILQAMEIDVVKPENEENDDDDSGPLSSPTQQVGSIIVDGEVGGIFLDECTLLGNVKGGDNPIQEALCDVGIKDVMLTPTIIFDTDNGYLHVSAELAITLMQWLEELN